MKFKVRIDQALFSISKRQSADHCLIATAIRQLVPNAKVGGSICFFAKLSDPVPMAEVVSNPEVRHVMQLFDDGKPFEVFPPEIEIEIPDNVIDFWYENASKAAAHIANARNLQQLPYDPYAAKVGPVSSIAELQYQQSYQFHQMLTQQKYIDAVMNPFHFKIKL